MARTLKKIITFTRKNGGFTLIELLAALIVLSIVSGIVILNLQANGRSARQSACKVDWRTIKAAMAAYYNDANTNAPDMVSLVNVGYLSDPNGRIIDLGYLDRNTYRIYIDGSGRIGIGKSTSAPNTPYNNNILDCNNVK